MRAETWDEPADLHYDRGLWSDLAVAALVKRWIDATHQGGIQEEHLPAYLDEFTFRSSAGALRSLRYGRNGGE